MTLASGSWWNITLFLACIFFATLEDSVFDISCGTWPFLQAVLTAAFSSALPRAGFFIYLVSFQPSAHFIILFCDFCLLYTFDRSHGNRDHSERWKLEISGEPCTLWLSQLCLLRTRSLHRPSVGQKHGLIPKGFSEPSPIFPPFVLRRQSILCISTPCAAGAEKISWL